MKAYNKKTGSLGEDFALRHLLNLNYELVARNYSTKFGEIDLIMRFGQVLVFVEVKTKNSLDFGVPEEMFTRIKYQKVKRMATLYLNGLEVPCRIDMVAVVLDQANQPISLHHYPNVYPL